MRRLLSLVVFVAAALPLGCTPAQTTATPEPQFTREQAIAAATRDAKMSAPEVGMQQAQVDEVRADLSGSTWQVHVRGRFLIEGMAPPGGKGAVYEASEQYITYDANTGRFLDRQVVDTRLVSPAVTPMTKEQAIERARGLVIYRGYGDENRFQEIRIDEATAELITLGEAERRLRATEAAPKGQTAVINYRPGADEHTPAWWVRLRGHFWWTARPTEGGGARLYTIYEAGERDFALYADDGTVAGGRVLEPRRVGTFPPVELRALPDFGTTTIRVGKVTNGEAGRQFLAAYQRGEPGRWELVYYSVEGDPVSNQLYYQGEGRGVYFVDDTTQDRFGGRRAVEYRCEEMVEVREGSRKALELRDCSPVRDGNQLEHLATRQVSLP